MRHPPYRIILFTIVILLFSRPPARASTGFAMASLSNAVQVQYASGDTEIGTISKNANFFKSEDSAIKNFPGEMADLQFTRRTFADAVDVTIDAPAGSTVYFIVGLGSSARNSRVALESGGWKRIGALTTLGSDARKMEVYKQTFTTSQHAVIPSHKGSLGALVAASELNLVSPSPDDQPPPDQTTNNEPSQNVSPSHVALQNTDSDAPPVRITKLQASIKMLCVLELANGEALGSATDLILTVSPGSPNGDSIPVTFSIPVGKQMSQVLDDVARAIDARYPRIIARKLEYSFEDRSNYDGPSVGAALGTLMLSSIQGFAIDPKFAITGDVSAEGKVRVIGGIGAKLRGAKDAGCTLVAVPNEDLEELIDAVIFNGASEIEDIQVIGISTLDDAVAIARTDRDPKEQQAIDLFSQIQQSIHASPNYLHTDDALNKLKHVTELAPNHLSARLLLQIVQNKQRQRLTAWASQYYAEMELNSVIPVLTDPNVATGSQHLMPAAVDSAIVKLRRLRPISDIRIQPFIDTCMELIQSRSDYNMGEISRETLMEKYQAYNDAYGKLQGDRALMEKMLHEGV